jgi:hypothetical protein
VWYIAVWKVWNHTLPARPRTVRAQSQAARFTSAAHVVEGSVCVSQYIASSHDRRGLLVYLFCG